MPKTWRIAFNQDYWKAKSLFTVTDDNMHGFTTDSEDSARWLCGVLNRLEKQEVTVPQTSLTNEQV